VFFFLPTFGGFVGWQVAVLLLALTVIQLAYEYHKWQEEKRDSQQS
jgi:hypothetical protein